MVSLPISDERKPKTESRTAYAYALRFLLVFVLYFALGELGLSVPFTSSNVSPVWPAAGFAVAAVTTFGLSFAAAVGLAAFLVNLLSPIPVLAAIGIAVGNACSAMFAGFVLRRLRDWQNSLPRLKDLGTLITVGAGLVTLISASVGAISLTVAHSKAWSGFGSAWRVWWLGDAMGVILLAPLLLAGKDLIRRCRGWRALELGLLSLLVLGVSMMIFGPSRTVRDDVLAFVVFPFVIWAAIRFRVAGAALASILAASVAVWGTAHGFGPFTEHEALHNAALLQLFIAVTALTGLLLATVVNERASMGEAIEKEQRLIIRMAEINEGLEERARAGARELEQKTAQLAHQARLLDLANDAIFVRGADDRISYWNEGAERLYGWTAADALGKTTHEILQTEFPGDPLQVLQAERWEGELRHRRRDGTKITVSSRWTRLYDDRDKLLGWLEINTDISGRKRAEEAARRLSGKILTLQDDERRRIARGLHDSLGQYLAALKMNLDILSKSDWSKSEVISECAAIVDKCVTEMRTISYLLHPPLLDEAGFGSAARWYVEGFAQRSGITVTLNLPQKLDRMHRDVELALFRAVQESLTNIHKHSGAASVNISMRADAEQIRLEIKDDGRGIPQQRLTHLVEGVGGAGVGIPGMRERVRELGGSFDIRANRSGTTVLIRLPVERL